jgi:tetratricopeptide (TPR) repeat protein
MKRILLLLILIPTIGFGQWYNPFDNSEELIKEGVRNQQNNNFNIAISKYKEALEYEQGYLIHYRIGLCYYNLSYYQDAITYFCKALSKVDNSFTMYRDQHGNRIGSETMENDILLIRAESYNHIKNYHLSNIDCNKLIKEYYRQASYSSIFKNATIVCLSDLNETSQIEKKNWSYAYKLKSYNFIHLYQYSKARENFELSLFLFPYDPELENLYTNFENDYLNYNPINLEKNKSICIIKNRFINF